jgi:hypothetical protein
MRTCNYIQKAFLLGLLGWSFSMGQSIVQDVISSGGHFGSNSNFSISSTIGEPAVRTYINGNAALTEGFQQPYFRAYLTAHPVSPVGLPLRSTPFNPVAYRLLSSVGVNPVSGNLTDGGVTSLSAQGQFLEFSSRFEGPVRVQLYNSNGHLVYDGFSKESNNSAERQSLSLNGIPSGIFYMIVKPRDSHIITPRSSEQIFVLRKIGQ